MPNTEKLKNEMDSLVADFVDGVASLVQETVDEAMSEAAANLRGTNGKSRRNGHSRVTKPKNGAKPKSSVQTKRAAANGKKNGVQRNGAKKKRTPEELEADRKKILAEIKKHPDEGIRAQDLGKKLGMETGRMKLPIDKLLDSQTITYSGKTRGTRYYPTA